MPALRRPIKWMLISTLSLTALSFWPWRPAPPAPAEQGLWEAARSANRPVPLKPLPARVDPPGFAAAEVDVFAMPRQPAAPAVAAVPPRNVPNSVPAYVPPPPSQPRTMVRFVGQMRNPDGQWLVYLRDGERILQAQPGAVLEGGFVVESLVSSGPEHGGRIAAVQLVYPPAQLRQTLDLPLEPKP